MQITPSTLAQLISPLSEDDFTALLRERKLLLQRGVGAERYAALLDWKTLLEMIKRGEHPPNLGNFRLIKESQMPPPDRWLKKDPAGDGNIVDVPRLLAYLNHGFSLSVTGIDRYAPHLRALCENIADALREQIKMGVIVTTGTGGAFKLHYDPEDLVILQVEGRKRWKIFGPPVINPVVGLPQSEPPRENMLLFDEVLEPGDFLFLPAGNWHRCENTGPLSLHLGLFFQPPNGIDVIKAITANLLSDDKLRLPLTRLGDAAEISDVESDIKDRAMERFSKLDLNDFFADFGKQ